MKILIVNDSRSYGGVATASEALKKCLMGDGDVVERYPIHNEIGSLPKRILSLARAFNYLRSSQFDKIILMHFEPIFLGLLSRVFHPKGTFVNTFHTDLPGYYSESSIFKKIILRIIFRLICEDLIVFVSREAELKSVESFGFKNTKTIYNVLTSPVGVESHSVRVAGARAFTFGSVSRLHSGKNVDLLIRVFNSFWMNHQDTRLAIFGDGPEFQRLRQYLLGFPCAPAVSFHGYQEDPAEIYRKFDALVGFSRIEGFGLVILDSLARGIPVLFSDCSCGPREILRPDSDPRKKTDLYEFCDGGVLFKLPLDSTAYASCLRESEGALVDVFKLFYESFDELKKGKFVDLQVFRSDVVRREWLDLLKA